MFMVKNFTKYLFGDGSKETIIEIPQGQLYLVRPLSPKGYSELIYKDAVASIRRTGQEFQYQLVVQRAYEEGEEELAEDDEGEANALDTDEKTFLLDQALHFRSDKRDGGEHVFAWRDLSGDVGDLYEFVCDSSVASEKSETFALAAVECQYERKYRKKAEFATDDELKEFEFSNEDSIPLAESISQEERAPTAKESTTHMAKEVKSSKKKPIAAANTAAQRTEAPPAQAAPSQGEEIVKQHAELHLFDFESASFSPVDTDVVATVSDLGSWRYWLQINSADGKPHLGQEVIADISPVFNFEYLSFIWNHYTEDGSAYSWLLRFKNREVLENFQEGLMQALWEQLNEQKWAKVKDQAEKDYVFEAFNDLTMDDAPPVDEEEEEEDEAEDDRPRSEHYDSDESDEDVDPHHKDEGTNSLLAVGGTNDRSYVVRGSKIGVFKHLPNKRLDFSTSISKIDTPSGKKFSPTKVMLHASDRDLVLQDAANPNSLYRMDLERGKVVDEWKAHDDIPVVGFGPETKFSQMTDAQPFIGHSRNALFRLDPRVSGNKLVESDMKHDIRLFDRLGVNAKTQVPALGDPINGIDVSADGRWILGTCTNYLLLIDALQTEGRYEGKLGFERSFAKDSKPKPRRLQPSPEHIAQIRHVTGKPLSFTQAKFNISQDGKETSIITSTGPYVITWTMKKVLAGDKDSYRIRKYGEDVMADSFEYGTDKHAILMLPNEVDMVARSSLKRPTRESIMAPGARLSGWVRRRRGEVRAGGLRS
ncbi:Vacuolar import and degradation protein 27 [Cyphellophora attinorum]|uniref:Vacuolar import and degradation protein 27 n=1 Tax=Cyphellophora attinorum TaxID=1664694 RepID=A0A0N1HA20_9EURO|nr:Vacuolar import and degradation protein 27 [Phialophora attinorum]KPI40553.1 Vacuolar import and degradation protein 27 [Phialophora attinorum]